VARHRTISENVVLERKLISSRAFRRLSKTAMIVLLDFMGKRQMEEVKHPRRKSSWQIKNNGEIQYTYKEAEGRGIPSSSFQRAIDQLIEHGFLSVSQTGAGVFRAATLYALDERWKDFGSDDFKSRKRTKKSRWKHEIGFQKGHPHYPRKDGSEK